MNECLVGYLAKKNNLHNLEWGKAWYLRVYELACLLSGQWSGGRWWGGGGGVRGCVAKHVHHPISDAFW